jgi:hypothetical protein
MFCWKMKYKRESSVPTKIFLVTKRELASRRTAAFAAITATFHSGPTGYKVLRYSSKSSRSSLLSFVP